MRTYVELGITNLERDLVIKLSNSDEKRQDDSIRELEAEKNEDIQLQMSPLEMNDEQIPPVFVAPLVVPMPKKEPQIIVSPPLSLESQSRGNETWKEPSLHIVFARTMLSTPRYDVVERFPPVMRHAIDLVQFHDVNDPTCINHDAVLHFDVYVGFALFIWHYGTVCQSWNKNKGLGRI